MAVELSNIVRCPRCRGLLRLENRPFCTNSSCRYFAEGFEQVGGQPVLIDFERSIFEHPRGDAMPSVLPRDRGLRGRLLDIVKGGNPTSVENSRVMLRSMRALSAKPTLLVVGGGRIGPGVDTFLQDGSFQVIATDVYASPNTQLVTDAHHLPFDDAVFDGVWIQAVLEHVLEPQVVVDEIWRVLNLTGLVYAETPFMAQVHEGAYDFTRFTASGHRWLFRRFEQLDAGVNRGYGPGLALAWSFRWFVRAFVGDKIATGASIPFYLLRLLDRFAHARSRADGALGVYFLGRKSEHPLAPKDMVAYYDSQMTWTN
jgi:SAM-dependent methyltransferase